MKDFCVITFIAMNQKHLDPPPPFIAAAADIALSDNTSCRITLPNHSAGSSNIFDTT